MLLKIKRIYLRILASEKLIKGTMRFTKWGEAGVTQS